MEHRRGVARRLNVSLPATGCQRVQLDGIDSTRCRCPPHREQRAGVGAAVLVAPITEYVRIVCPAVVAGVVSCQPTSGVSEYALSNSRRNPEDCGPYSTGANRAT